MLGINTSVCIKSVPTNSVAVRRLRKRTNHVYIGSTTGVFVLEFICKHVRVGVVGECGPLANPLQAPGRVLPMKQSYGSQRIALLGRIGQ